MREGRTPARPQPPTKLPGAASELQVWVAPQAKLGFPRSQGWYTERSLSLERRGGRRRGQRGRSRGRDEELEQEEPEEWEEKEAPEEGRRSSEGRESPGEGEELRPCPPTLPGDLLCRSRRRRRAARYSEAGSTPSSSRPWAAQRVQEGCRRAGGEEKTGRRKRQKVKEGDPNPGEQPQPGFPL